MMKRPISNWFLLPLLISLLAGHARGLELRQTDRVIEVWSADEKLILRYHKAESELPEGVPEVYRRSGYIHPVMTPGGRAVTGDFPEDHLHQHALFMAWTSGSYAGRKIDFWNQKKEEGRVAHKRVVATDDRADQVSFTVELSHTDQRGGGKEILSEIWKVTVFPTPDDHYKFDIESRQSLVAEKPLQIKKHRYGGMALHGPGEWLGAEACDFLTSEGKARIEGNHTRPDWVAMSGEIDGEPASVAVFGSPRNFRSPQSVRIHPDKPYFCFAPMVDGDFSIDGNQAYVSRYRYLVADKAADRSWIDPEWEAYAKEADPGGGASRAADRPHIVLVMTDDQGYGETGYYNHPCLKTPHLDAMAANGLRFDRFYAGAPVCSPTRASVLTGRSNDRTGVPSHGHALRHQERTLAPALRAAGYATGHFGKWHLNALRGPGVPILENDAYGPGRFGFDRWVSVTNFFDLDPIMSRGGKFEEFRGDSSEISVAEALKFIGEKAAAGTPTFSVIWFGTPHSPFRASDEDGKPFADLDAGSREHYGELVAMDRSIGALRAGLREIGIADDTLIWFNSDNGGLPKIKPGTVGELRGFKGSVYEGGLRVPGIVEWPAGIKPRITQFPACTMDIFPTIADIVGLGDETRLQPQDGISLLPLFEREIGKRSKPIPFRHNGRIAVIDNEWKLIRQKARKRKGEGQDVFELYHLTRDPAETKDLSETEEAVFAKMRQDLIALDRSIDASVQGADYPGGTVNPGHPEPRFWTEVEAYRPYFDAWKKRPEYQSRLKK